MSEAKIRPNDFVRHKPSGETWVVCGVSEERNELVPMGYPFPTLAKLSDCVLVKSRNEPQTQEQKTALLKEGMPSLVEQPEPPDADTTYCDREKFVKGPLQTLCREIAGQALILRYQAEEKGIYKTAVETVEVQMGAGYPLYVVVTGGSLQELAANVLRAMG